MKICNSCKIELPQSDFYVVKKREQGVVYHICKSCCATQKSKSKDYYRNWELQKKYNITLEQYREASKIRENKCDICKDEVKSLHVDHCHSSGRIRGYLCGPCNRGLGLFKDTKETIQKALTYLENYEDFIYT